MQQKQRIKFDQKDLDLARDSFIRFNSYVEDGRPTKYRINYTLNFEVLVDSNNFIVRGNKFWIQIQGIFYMIL